MVVLSHHAVDIDNAFLKPRTIKNRFFVDYYMLVVPDNFIWYIIYISRAGITFFADDTVVYTSANDAATLEAQLNVDLRQISEWFFVNRLTLNESKCKFVLFSSTLKLKSFQNFSLCINDS